ncbi:hypothetical protein [Saccharopolyspora taberi]|uniref:Uncharacterized protein n=1 Tax=Saccharopolyspora taberi TaxID=60895 RepID=A0ABN3VDH0_9PSEU
MTADSRAAKLESISDTGGRRPGRALVLAAQAGLGFAVVLGWEFGVRAGVVDEFFFSALSDIALRVGQWRVLLRCQPTHR